MARRVPRFFRRPHPGWSFSCLRIVQGPTAVKPSISRFHDSPVLQLARRRTAVPPRFLSLPQSLHPPSLDLSSRASRGICASPILGFTRKLTVSRSHVTCLPLPHFCPYVQLPLFLSSSKIRLSMRTPSPLFCAMLVMFSLSLVGCGSTTSSDGMQQPPDTPSITVAVSPSTANVRAGNSASFTATVSGTTNTTVTWSVNNSAGGSTSLGNIDSSGNYSAPASVP